MSSYAPPNPSLYSINSLLLITALAAIGLVLWWWEHHDD